MGNVDLDGWKTSFDGKSVPIWMEASCNKLHDRMKITSCFTFAFDVCNFYTVLKILFSVNVSCLCLFIC